uniref:Uncharacterized protein n=1 Tax=Brassica napus TaxID=3708 RepID=A0A068FAZ9_BRANA|nr:hypothetical protein GSBNAPT00096232010_7N2 [Brassica napus]
MECEVTATAEERLVHIHEELRPQHVSFSNDGIAGSGLLFVLPDLTVASRFEGAFLSGGSRQLRAQSAHASFLVHHCYANGQSLSGLVLLCLSLSVKLMFCFSLNSAFLLLVSM